MAGGVNYRVFSPEVWSPYIKVYFKDRLYAAKFFNNFTAELQKQGGDTITLPNLTEGPDPTSLTVTTGDLTDFIVVETRTQLTVDAWVAQSKKFSDFEASRIMKNYNLQMRYLKGDLMPKLAKKFEQELIGQTGAVKDLQLHTGTSLVSISNTTITEALRIAETFSMPIEECAFFFHVNTYYKQLFRRVNVIDASQFGKALQPAGDVRPLGVLYGVPVYVSNLVGLAQGLVEDGYPATTRRNLLVHPRTVAYAYGRLTPDGPRFQEQPVGNALAMRIVADIMYGKALPGKAQEGIRLMTVA
ncbi:MAG TPA: hypothetical protein ENH85_01230 [Candidatus Scalindua sp.]|nr:hypothetical protein [Candidatus Scalindua sp.]